jgi:hypothetical protein
MSIFERLFGANGGTPTTNTPPAVPAASAATPPVEPPQGLDQFKELFQPPKVDPNAPPTDAPLINMDASKVQEIASKINFAQAVPAETLQAMQAGGEGAVAAFVSAMNTMTQQVYAQNALATGKLIEQAVAKATSQFTGNIPEAIRQQNAQEALRAANPAFAHPAVQPIVNMVSEQLRKQFPQATAAELSDMTQQYMNTAATALSPQAQAAQAAKGQEDWSKFFPPEMQ